MGQQQKQKQRLSTCLLACLVGGVLFCAPYAVAQTTGASTDTHADKGTTTKTSSPELTPNLTVNIVLNSALSEKETEFYSKIAQDLINRLPRELRLDDQMRKLKDMDNKYENMNVVAYFPPDATVSGVDKVIKHFKVRFSFDGKSDLKRPEDAEKIAVPLKPESEETLPNDTLTVGLIKPPLPDVTPAEGNTVAEAEDTSVTAATTPAEKPAAPAAEPAAAPAKPKPAPKKVVAPKVSTRKLRLEYTADNTDLSLPQRQQLMRFIHQLREDNRVKDFVFVVRSYAGPFGDMSGLGEERLHGITALMRQQDINVSHSGVTEIYIQSDADQFIELQALLKD